MADGMFEAYKNGASLSQCTDHTVLVKRTTTLGVMTMCSE